MKKKRKSQAVLDYAAIIGIVALALVAMSGYIFKAMNARVVHVQKDLNNPITGIW